MEGDSIKVRMLYQHKSGKIFFMHGFAEDENKRLVCIISSVDTGKPFTRPASLFEGDDATFQLAKPS